jgi:hypothetical protein
MAVTGERFDDPAGDGAPVDVDSLRLFAWGDAARSIEPAGS